MSTRRVVNTLGGDDDGFGHTQWATVFLTGRTSDNDGTDYLDGRGRRPGTLRLHEGDPWTPGQTYRTDLGRFGEISDLFVDVGYVYGNCN